MWWEWWPGIKTEPELDRDRKVTLTIGQLTDALAEALKVVTDASEEPKWKKGDRAFVEVEVTGIHGLKNEHANIVVVGVAGKERGISVPLNILEAVDE